LDWFCEGLVICAALPHAGEAVPRTSVHGVSTPWHSTTLGWLQPAPYSNRGNNGLGLPLCSRPSETIVY